MKLFKKHKCPADVQISIFINHDLIVGPITGEELAYVARFGGWDADQLDLMETVLTGGQIKDIQVLVKYLPPARR